MSQLDLEETIRKMYWERKHPILITIRNFLPKIPWIVVIMTAIVLVAFMVLAETYVCEGVNKLLHLDCLSLFLSNNSN
jgi:hypothetical protein